jgi:outer membrane protein OmpU
MQQKLLAMSAVAAGSLVATGAWAQGIALFGDARLGFGYNIDNDGGILVDDDGDTPDDLRAVGRVRFGVDMTGQTDSGITFGATIRADNAEGGEGGTDGQTEGSVFVSGSFGTLSFGDTNGADEQWVGDVPGDFSLTGLGDLDETRFISNGGDFGSDGGSNFAANPFARPTIRYDFDVAGFGISVSSDRDLGDIGVGAGYAADFGGGSWSLGVGYYSYDSFLQTSEGLQLVDDGNGNSVVEPGETIDAVIPDGEQWSVGLKADYDAVSFGATWVRLDSDTNDYGEWDADDLLVGVSYTFEAWSVGAVYGRILGASGVLAPLDDLDSYELSAQYDLGGGSTLNGGVRRSYDLFDVDGSKTDAAWIGDLGISMSF